MKVDKLFDGVGAETPRRSFTEPAALPPKADSLALLDPQADQNFEGYVEDIKQITRAATTKALTSTADQAQLSELVSKARTAHKGLEYIRVQAVAPLNEKVKKINSKVKVIQAAIDAFTARADVLLLAWTKKEQARIERETAEVLRKQEEAALAEAEAMALAEAADTAEERGEALALAEKASEAQMVAATEAPRPATRGMRTDSGSTYITKRWVFDVLAPERLPRQYLKADDAAIRAAVAAGVREIPGVSIHEEESIGHRTA